MTTKQKRYERILFFIPFVRPVWKLWLAGMAITFFVTAISSILPLSSKILIDFVILGEGFQRIEAVLEAWRLTVLIGPVKYLFGSVNLIILSSLALGLGIGLLEALQGILSFKVQQEVILSIQASLFDHILCFPMSILKKSQTGYLMSRVTSDVGMVQYAFSQGITQLITSLFYPVFIFFILFNINVGLSLILLAALAANAFVYTIFSGRVRQLSHREMEAWAKVSGDMQEVISGIEVIKSHASEKREGKRVTGRLRDLFRIRLKGTLLNSASGYSMKGIKLIAVMLITWLATYRVLDKTMTMGDLAAFGFYTLYLTGVITGLFSNLLSFQPVFASMDRLYEMFSIASEHDGHKGADKALVPEKVNGKIRIHDVSFQYEPSAPVLKNISLTVNPGETIAITGASGAGKTTLMSLLLKFNLPVSGEIYLDDNPLVGIDARWLRQQIGIVSQETFLFNDTIEHNIRYGKPEATAAEVVNAAKKAHIHEEILNFEAGYQTIAGERGVNMSAGQRQRISLARTFLKNPPVVIFDEPTSAIDGATEEALKASLREITQNRTTFIISHRMSVVDIADRTFELKDGILAEK